jgi:hypothetical protein
MRHAAAVSAPSILDEFITKATLLVNQWNVAHAAECKGRLVLEVSEASPRDDRREVQLFSDVGTRARPSRILLLAVSEDPVRGLVGNNSLVPVFPECPMSIEHLSGILDHYRPIVEREHS